MLTKIRIWRQHPPSAMQPFSASDSPNQLARYVVPPHIPRQPFIWAPGTGPEPRHPEAYGDEPVVVVRHKFVRLSSDSSETSSLVLGTVAGQPRVSFQGTGWHGYWAESSDSNRPGFWMTWHPSGLEQNMSRDLKWFPLVQGARSPIYFQGKHHQFQVLLNYI